MVQGRRDRRLFFFFQAEDGIRDYKVTGVQTCALPISVARYEPGEMPGTTEIAIVVEDGWQHRGLGSLLLDALLAAAERRNLRVFTADVLADNRPMLRVLSRLADIRRRESNHGILTLEFQRRQMREARLACPRGARR